MRIVPLEASTSIGSIMDLVMWLRNLPRSGTLRPITVAVSSYYCQRIHDALPEIREDFFVVGSGVNSF